MSADIIQFGGAPVARVATALPEFEGTHPHGSQRETKERIDRHIAARDAHGRAVAWEAAAIAQRLPAAQIEEAGQRTVAAYAETVERARQLVVCSTACDPKGLIDLLLYLETNWTTLPDDLGKRALVFELLKSMRLSLRSIAKYGKYEGCRDDK